MWMIDNVGMELISKDTSFLTPYGSCKCHVYKYIKNVESRFIYCVPYIGIVGVVFEHNGEVVRKRVLSDYHIGL